MANRKDKPAESAKPDQKQRQSGSAKSNTPDEIKRNAATLATGIGVTAPDDAGTRPKLNLDFPLKALGREFGMLSHGANLFRRGEDFVTVDERDGKVRSMTPERFCSYAEELAWTFKTTREGKPSFSRLWRELARLILQTDDFRAHVRELRAVYEMSLPVWRGEGEARTIELLPRGYDAETKVFTLGTLAFDENRDPGEAQEWLLKLLHEFPWAEAEECGGIVKTRSLAAHVAGMLAPFCPLLIGEHARRPMFPYLANQVGSGKTLLAKMALAPVFGEPVTINADQRPEELEKKIETAVLEERPYLFLDDCGSFKSRVLNMLLTSGRIAARIMGQSKMPDLPNRMQIYVTGNGIDLGSDLARRAVIADLFYPGEAAQRRFQKPITDEWLFQRETRARFLAVLWAFVRHWRDTYKLKEFPDASRASFEKFSAIVGSVVIGAGFANPFAARESLLGGDEAGAALRELLRAVASDVADTTNPPELRPKAPAEKADELGLLDGIVGMAKHHEMALGQKLRLLRGRQFRDSKGRLFEFGRRKGNRGAIYPLRFIAE